MSLMMPASAASSVRRSARRACAPSRPDGRRRGASPARCGRTAGSPPGPTTSAGCVASSGRAARAAGWRASPRSVGRGAWAAKRNGPTSPSARGRPSLATGSSLSSRRRGVAGVDGGGGAGDGLPRVALGQQLGAARAHLVGQRRSLSTRSMHAASSAALPGSNSRPAPVPSTSSASPPVRATTSGAPPASASRATMPNGSYSDGMTTQPARWTVSRSWSSGRKPGRSTRSLTPSRSICDCSSGR